MSTDNPFLQVFRVWAGMAWADGVIDPREASAMKTLINQAGLEDGVRDQALSYLSEQVELDLEAVGKLPESAREGIYQAAARLAMVDQNLASGERAFLDQLRGALSLSDERVAAIEQDVGL